MFAFQVFDDVRYVIFYRIFFSTRFAVEEKKNESEGKIKVLKQRQTMERGQKNKKKKLGKSHEFRTLI